MVNMEPITGDRLVASVVCKVIPWLLDPSYDPKTLINWCQGYNLPPIGHNDDPYLWIYRAVEYVKKELARRIAVFLDEKPDIHRPGDRPGEVLYNLLMLSAALNCPDILYKPLKRMKERKVLPGDWLGVPLAAVLDDALCANQPD